MRRRKLLCPIEYLRMKFPGKKVTRQRIGKLHADMRARGLVSSSPVTAPPHQTTVWIDRCDPFAKVMLLAAQRATVTLGALMKLLGIPAGGDLPRGQLSQLGVAIVPNGRGRCWIVGTSPELARVANRAYHGQRRRTLERRWLIQEVEGIKPNGRAVSVTEKRLIGSLDFMDTTFDLDFSGLIGAESILV